MASLLNAFDGTLVLLGAGNMGRAMLEGWLASGLDSTRFVAIDPNPNQTMTDLAYEHGLTLVKEVSELPSKQISILVLAVKPQIAAIALPQIKGSLNENSLVISVAAGKTLGFLEAQCAPAKCIRTIPNTPALVGRGMTGALAGQDVSDAQRRAADILLSSTGQVEWVEDENLIDAITAISGSGPAYIFHMVEALAKAGEALGVAPDMADRLARATVEGAGELLFQSDEAAGTLRQNVTSPAGTTAAALDILMSDDGLTSLMSSVTRAAYDRSIELAAD